MPARPISPRSVTVAPLYQQVKESLVQRLTDKEWLPGDFLPSEMSLAEEYNVSQGTIRKAMNALSRERVLTRHQGKGTSVAVLNESSAMFRFFTLITLDGERVFPVSTVHAAYTGKATAAERVALRLNPDAHVVRVERVRLLDGTPIINEYITLPCALFPDFELRADHIANALYEYYASNYKISIIRADEHIRAVPADAMDAERLNVCEGTPLLMTTRIAYSLQDAPIECRISRILTDHYTYLSALR